MGGTAKPILKPPSSTLRRTQAILYNKKQCKYTHDNVCISLIKIRLDIPLIQNVLKDYLVKGYALNDETLRTP